MAEWAVRAALAAGWWTLPAVLGAGGMAVMGAARLAAALWGLPRRAKARRRARARHQAAVRRAQRKAQAEHIEMLERMWRS